jgi:hypothetical protein
MYILILAKIPILIYLTSLILILPIFIGFINIKEIKNTPFSIIFTYCVFYLILESISWFYALNKLQNHFIDNISIYVEIIMIGLFYFKVISNPIQKKIILSITTISVILILWSNLGTGRDFNRIDSFASSIGNIGLIAIALIFFFQLFNNLEVKNLFIYPHFWISIAVLIYFSGVFFVNVFAEYITFNKDESIIQYWIIKQYLTFFHRIFLALGLWFSRTPIQSNLSSK